MRNGLTNLIANCENRFIRRYNGKIRMNTSERDQAIASVRDLLPALWYSLYKQSIEEGFNEVQAFELVKVYITAYGIK